MFSLFYGFYEYMTRKEEFHILIIGLDKAGKTTVLERLKTLYSDYSGLEPSQIMPTVGLNIARFDAKKSPLVFWDLGGQPALRSIWEKYYAETHAVLFVVDASHIDRIQEAKTIMDKTLGSMDLHGAPLLVLANKQDAPGAVGGVELKERLGLGKLDSRACDVQPSSALTGDGLQSAIEWLVGSVKRSKRTESLRHKTGLSVPSGRQHRPCLCQARETEGSLARREISFALLAAPLLAAAATALPQPAVAGVKGYEPMPALKDKDYGKSRMKYSDYVTTKSGLQYQDLVEGKGAYPKTGQTAVVDWSGVTIGYYGRPFEARNKARGGAFTGDDKAFFRFRLGDPGVIPAFNEAVSGMKVGGVRRIIVPPELGYPDNELKKGNPAPATFSGKRALDFVLKNQGMIDKTLLFDIELIKVAD